MNIPAAPKDPEKRRDFFYIIKNKAIFGTKMEDGKLGAHQILMVGARNRIGINSLRV